LRSSPATAGSSVGGASPADQRGGNARRIAGAEPVKEQRRQRQEGDQRQQHQQPAFALGRVSRRRSCRLLDPGWPRLGGPPGDAAAVEIGERALLREIVGDHPGDEQATTAIVRR